MEYILIGMVVGFVIQGITHYLKHRKPKNFKEFMKASDFEGEPIYVNMDLVYAITQDTPQIMRLHLFGGDVIRVLGCIDRELHKHLNMYLNKSKSIC